MPHGCVGYLDGIHATARQADDTDTPANTDAGAQAATLAAQANRASARDEQGGRFAHAVYLVPSARDLGVSG
jgi:hypothetical protein